MLGETLSCGLINTCEARPKKNASDPKGKETAFLIVYECDAMKRNLVIFGFMF